MDDVGQARKRDRYRPEGMPVRGLWKKKGPAPPYPLKVIRLRELPPDYDGVVHIWDVDKTYLDTHFSSVKGMARIPVEFSVDKRAIPGMPQVLRGIRWGNGTDYAGVPIIFVTASPVRMQGVLRTKMTLDGIEYDVLLMKDWMACLRGLRPGRLREQLGFKVCALLSLRAGRTRAMEYLYGDDTEDDAQAYALYARLITGEMSAGEAEAKMEALGIKKDDRRCIIDSLDRLGHVTGRVKQAFIHLEKGADPEEFKSLGDIVRPVRGAGQLAMALFQQRQISRNAAIKAMDACERSLRWRVTDEMKKDAIARGLITREKAEDLIENKD